MNIIKVVAILMMLAGCGTAVGAGAGGLVGNQFGKGSGKAAATAGGAGPTLIAVVSAPNAHSARIVRTITMASGTAFCRAITAN